MQIKNNELLLVLSIAGAVIVGLVVGLHRDKIEKEAKEAEEKCLEKASEMTHIMIEEMNMDIIKNKKETQS